MAEMRMGIGQGSGFYDPKADELSLRFSIQCEGLPSDDLKKIMDDAFFDAVMKIEKIKREDRAIKNGE